MPDQGAGECILTLNGGSSSVKFALFTSKTPLRRVFDDEIDTTKEQHSPQVLMHELARRIGKRTIAGVGHRVVHGGINLVEHQIIDDRLIEELRRSVPLDLAHLPAEIELIEAARDQFRVPHVACFDTAFHGDLPRVAKLLPIPRKFDEAGVRRLGFHGLSFTYLMDQLRRIGKGAEAEGRVILAHLGAGSSLAAVRNGKPIDTSMCFTPTAGVVMATRPGDLDPGLIAYIMRTEKLGADQIDELLNHECGLIGVSQTSSDMRELLRRRESDRRAAEAIELFCYSIRKCIGAYAATLGGLDTLVFSAGIGEKSPPLRGEICYGLDFLGLRLDETRNAKSDPIISTDDSRVTVRVIPTDEESVIASIVLEHLQTKGQSHA